jgi:hypothetical protein
VGSADRRRIDVGCVRVEFGRVDRRIDFRFGGYGVDDDVDDGGGGRECDVCDACDEWGRERRAVDDVLPRRGAEWSGA